MKLKRPVWAGACLLLALSGCSKDEGGLLDDEGVYSPLITNLAANHQPAIRGGANELTVIITNVNSYPITYHWSAGAGTLTDSTGETATWVTPDAVGTYPITVSIEAHDTVADKDFFRTRTFQVFVDNDYVRWTRTPEIQFDPAPTPAGGVLFAEYYAIAANRADVYHVAQPGLSAEKLTQDFHTAVSPTMRSDGLQIAFAGKRRSSEVGPSIWLLPATGGDTTMAIGAAVHHPVVPLGTSQGNLGNARFARTASWLLYNSDSGSIGAPRPWFRDAFNLASQPERVVSAGGGTTPFLLANWGPDVDQDGLPDSVVSQSFRFFGQPSQSSRGFFKFATRPPQSSTAAQWLPDSTASEPDWSADGQWIVYAKPNRDLTRDRDIWIIRAGTNDRSTAIRVTHGPADDSHPRFSADGSTIYFVSNRADYYGLNGIFPTERRGTNIWSVSRFDRP